MLAVQGIARADETLCARAAFGEKLPRGSTRHGRQHERTSGQKQRTRWRGSDGGVVKLWTGTALESVEVDPVRGPRVLQPDGRLSFMADMDRARWSDLDSSDQKLLVYRAAYMNQGMIGAVLERVEEERIANWERMAEESPEARMRMRCEREMERGAIHWSFISLDTVSQGHDKIAPGMLYGLPFPWSEETLAQFGPEWLTSAFHACGSLSRKNRVTKIIVESEVKITAGNNSGKFLFEVEYARMTPGLQTKLFAKIPFAMTPATQSDRFSSSVYKQPMDLFEINTYRLLESSFPMKTPRFYYGDISNETSNFILITERVPFAELDGLGKRKLEPFEVEGPYDKCKDFQLQGRDKEYYGLLMKVTGRIAGYHKAGWFGDDSLLQGSVSMPRAPLDVPALWGANANAATGMNHDDLPRKLEAAVKFMCDTARVLYPEYMAGQDFRQKFTKVMLKRSAYHAEIDFWKHSKPDYVALGHQNLNADNAYFWRDAEGELDCGVYDWGGFGSSCVGHKIYWMFNCADFEQVKVNLSDYLDIFITEYHASGGPLIDRDVLQMQVLLTCLENLAFMVNAVPNCFKMCPQKEWATIKDRHDPRIAGNIDSKSTLRTTLHCLGNGARIIEEMKADEVLERWINEVYVGEWGLEAKTDAIITGA